MKIDWDEAKSWAFILLTVIAAVIAALYAMAAT